MTHLVRPEWLDESKDRAIRLYRVTIADEEFPRRGMRRIHFASVAEAQLVEKEAAQQGLTTYFHEIDVPTNAVELASWLDDYHGAGCAFAEKSA